ncbi:MAG: hypothetical protein M1812_002816 [Candelaria pacifica]|nr:MAG: hypothetical protein M1812_002816 [Candelaria pacifica]
MNNTQFRKLVLDTPTIKPSSKDGVAATPRGLGATPVALGSRMRSSIPMTPRSVMGSSGVDFARQLAERDQGERPAKKFRSSAAPKGTKLASGYRDRTQERSSVEEDEKASRVKALEEMLKLQQIDRDTFEKLRDQITGGDIGATHLVKGLDYKLLERVRKGEDVLSQEVPEPVEEDVAPTETKEVAVDEEFEKLEDREIAPIMKQKSIKKGEMAPPPAPGAIAGKKRSRNEIIAELKASRQAAAAAAQPSLGPKFRKLGEKKVKSRIERDEKGREVLITVDENGRVKRKVRRVNVEQEIPAKGSDLLMPDKDAKPLGMDVPEIIAPPLDDEDEGDIFEGAGADYDPLGGIGEDDDDTSDEEIANIETTKQPSKSENDAIASPSQSSTSSLSTSPNTPPSPPPPPPPAHQPPSKPPRNYFSTPSTSTPTQDPLPPPPINPLTDPKILAALKKASSITLTSTTTDTDTTSPEETARLLRHQKLLSTHDRDAEDMDLGFGSSRFGDEDEGEEERGGKVKLSVWNGGGDGKEDGREAKGRDRKRGAKKRKGDKDSAKDVLGVLERRKGGEKK